MQPRSPKAHGLVCRHVTGNLSSLEPKQTHFLLALALFLDDELTANPSIQELAEAGNLSPSTVERAKKSFKGNDLFVCEERRGGRHNLRTTYRFSREVLDPLRQNDGTEDPTLRQIDGVCLIVDIDTETNLTPASREEETKTTSTPTSKSTPTSTPIQSNIDSLRQIDGVYEEEEELRTGPDFDWQAAYAARPVRSLSPSSDVDELELSEGQRERAAALADRKEAKRLADQRANLDELRRTLSEAASRRAEAIPAPKPSPSIPSSEYHHSEPLFTQDEVAELLPELIAEARERKEVKRHIEKPWFSEEEREEVARGLQQPVPIHQARPTRPRRASQRASAA
jgi:hypothetical protein